MLLMSHGIKCNIDYNNTLHTCAMLHIDCYVLGRNNKEREKGDAYFFMKLHLLIMILLNAKLSCQTFIDHVQYHGCLIYSLFHTHKVYNLYL